MSDNPRTPVIGAATRLSEKLWEARAALEAGRRPGDPSWVWLGELANALEESDIKDTAELDELFRLVGQLGENTR